MEEVFGAVGKKCTPRSSHFGAKQLPSLAPDLARGTEPHTGAWDSPGQLLGAALGLPGWGSPQLHAPLLPGAWVQRGFGVPRGATGAPH